QHGKEADSGCGSAHGSNIPSEPERLPTAPCNLYIPSGNCEHAATLLAAIPSDGSRVHDARELRRKQSQPVPSLAPPRATLADHSPTRDTQCSPEACLQLCRAQVPKWNQLPTG